MSITGTSHQHDIIAVRRSPETTYASQLSLNENYLLHVGTFTLLNDRRPLGADMSRRSSRQFAVVRLRHLHLVNVGLPRQK